ncbi:MAG: FAD-binding protein [Gammaproteobacteria bacterium]|nr:FAD-binding protein [Gammaproteobacteria bacterium]
MSSSQPSTASLDADNPAAARATHADGTLDIEPALAVENAASFAWDERCDVLVVGFGAAGAAAAIAAKEAGAAVLLADRFEGGGATEKSGGVVYAGGGTPHQRKLGYEDTPEAMFRYLRLEVGDAVGEATLRRFCEDSPALIGWLESLGANFESSEPPPKTSYPKDGVYLYYSGNEAVERYAKEAKPAPRGHRTRGSWLSGKALFGFLRARVESLGIPVLRQAGARRLITDRATGAVLGAELYRLPPGSKAAQRHRRLMRWAEAIHNFAGSLADKLRAKALELERREAKPLRVRAARGVVLTAGGFVFNRTMLAQHAPKYLHNMRLGATGCDGSGIRLGQSVGGAVARMQRVSAWRFINPPTAWPKGVVVNREGRRFCNEQVYGATLGVEMCEQHEGRAWLILDAKLRRAAIREALFGKLWPFQSIPALLLMLFAPRARTLEQLAARLGFSAEALRDTVNTCNNAARGLSPDPLGKSAAYLAPVEQRPFYALDISAANRGFPCPSITLGGLRVDETGGAVLNAGGQPVAGLYAAGRSAVGIASNNYVSGLSLADCLWSGRRAGAAAAQAPASAAAQRAA